MLFPGEEDRPTATLALAYAGADGGPDPHLSVDGMTPSGPNLSHWPGNRTPAAWKADLSAGIALRFARASAEEQRAFLGDAQHVVNDHYDTDGFGALLAVLRPDVAFRCEDTLLAAARVGDFGVWHTWRGFAIDRIVKNLADRDSPVAGAFHGANDEDSLAFRRYQWLLENAESVLENTGGYRSLYEAEMALVQEEVDRGLRGGLRRDVDRQLGLSVLTSVGPQHRMTLNTLAGAWRVLHVLEGSDGVRYRYHDRTESWFELVTFQPPKRRDLRPLRDALRALEPEHDGAAWHADPPETPIPELYFGPWSEQDYGEITRELRPSRLRPDAVRAALTEFFQQPTG
ncbi:MAG: DUF6687 family protein [Planctomycetota bacterium]|nr:DUF6687 family protein [Planctomycetota bacterium]